MKWLILSLILLTSCKPSRTREVAESRHLMKCNSVKGEVSNSVEICEDERVICYMNKLFDSGGISCIKKDKSE